MFNGTPIILKFLFERKKHQLTFSIYKKTYELVFCFFMDASLATYPTNSPKKEKIYKFVSNVLIHIINFLFNILNMAT